MELQWPLILFTTLTAWACGVFGAQGVLALKGGAKKSQSLLTIVSVVLLALGGIAVFFHLQHWERIFNGFGHITSGITQELIAIVVFCIVAIAYFILLRKSDDNTVPAWCAWTAIVISVVLACVCAHSYMMPARPAWNNVLEIASIVGASCVLGPVTCALVMTFKGDDTKVCSMPAAIGSIIAAICTGAYAAFMQTSGGAFTQVGNYFDPTHPTKAMANITTTTNDQAALLWLGAVVVGALVPLVCCVLAHRKGGQGTSWKLFGTIALICAVAGAIILRVVFYNMGLSVFMFY